MNQRPSVSAKIERKHDEIEEGLQGLTEEKQYLFLIGKAH